MCGRFTLTAQQKELAEAFAGYTFTAVSRQRFNIAPTQEVLVALNDGSREIVSARWGLIPRWVRTVSAGKPLINARAETVAEKPAFRGPLRRQRCLVLADGFYEWKTMPGQRHKVPYHIRLRSRRPFAFAGLWDRWRAPQGHDVLSCVIITTEPNELMAPIHDRMPVILGREDMGEWTREGEGEVGVLTRLLRSYPAGEMEARVVCPRVNSPSVDDAACLDDVPSQSELGL